MNKKFKFIFKDKKNYKVILYLLFFVVFIFFVYFFIPKFFNYTPKLVQESLKKNSDINIEYISNIDYQLLPSPRLKLSGVYLELGKNILSVENAELEIILNPLRIINYKILDYHKLLLKNGSTNIEIKKINKIFNYIKKNQNKINFKNNTTIFLRENKKLFEINNSLVKFNTKNNTQLLNLNGLFLNHKASFILKEKKNNKINITLKVPELDISTNIFLENIDNFKIFKGIINLEVLNNFFQFNFIKEKKITISKGFIRGNLINSSFEGDISFRPYFLFNLDIKPSSFDIKKLVSIIKKIYFTENFNAIEIIKKIDGSLNFKDSVKGRIIFKNREIELKNFELDKEKKIFLNAEILEFGKKGKMQFNLINNVKKINITGIVIPSSLKINFEKIMFEDKIFSPSDVKKYEKKFKNEVLQNSLVNILSEVKLNNFFKNFKD
jgi:hypothetical protein